MCGIVGYIGNRQAYPILIKGLHRLEYRGYDSAGIALIDQDHLKVYKAKGKVAELEQFAQQKDTSGTIGIAHTRWATHGEPTQNNAHPHYSQSEDIAIIHNGIIENHAILKDGLIKEGYRFQSQTDTEVLVQLIEYMKITHDVDLPTAVQLALTQVVGAYAIAVLERNKPDLIVTARKGSPLVIGIGEDEYFIGSDATPLIEYTNQVIYVGDEEIVTIKRNEPLKIKTIGNIEKTPEIQKLELTLSQLEKSGYPHFMLKEIFEQPATLSDCMRGRVNVESDNITLAGFIDNRDKFLNARRIIITACGTSWHAAQIGMYSIEEYARIPVEVEYSSEFRYRKPVIHKDDIVIAISQSGETADTLAAVELAKQQGAFIFGICNVVGSSIPRNTHSGCYTHVGPEIGVASTKAFTAQVAVLTMLGILIAKEKGTITSDEYVRFIKELSLIPDKVGEVLQKNDQIAELAKTFTYASNCIYLGRGYNFPVALEGALKLKEISYIHAEGYPAAEMKHGPIALISHEMPVIAIATQSDTYEKVASNIQEIKARKGRIISIVTEGDEAIRNLSAHTIEVPETIPCLTPLLSVIPLQLLAYHIAVEKGCDVDQPRNLAKSVTVE
ncbi:MAG: glutamine--fructose-6-phosphate transaminase (isomerizing) [Proteiniphilum sp.]|jgi:glucosamine--fructose-6-phosphate aminotransferase (isomerizing)|nr:glutamine--fructose-6-phosphate transaminase (isomerizing) [Proteiniphilum sp.]MDD3075439.1 glutamine--fructose-6-phosphate transaminase (isomerizing) [Proteiniphilum sp.]MDD3954912.1 glutamine--fructose-6-phosphate transaminase (isomerizing) [Proteiniphilum sp.]MDD4453440.1 glutamine--fructose-6-phosphate transaminase (isomerizing) [Proteiniphilum sp.]